MIGQTGFLTKWLSYVSVAADDAEPTYEVPAGNNYDTLDPSSRSSRKAVPP